jgi:hypothetical protein
VYPNPDDIVPCPNEVVDRIRDNYGSIETIAERATAGNYIEAAEHINALRAINIMSEDHFKDFFDDDNIQASAKLCVKAEIDFQNQAIQNLKNARRAFLDDDSGAALKNITSDVLSQRNKIYHDGLKVRDALNNNPNDARTADQRRGDLRLMIIDRDEMLRTLSEPLPDLGEKIRTIQTKFDQHIEKIYKNSKDGSRSPAGVGELAAYAADAAAELAPLVVQHRIDRLNKEGRKAEADRLVENRFIEEEKFRKDFKAVYEKEMLRYVQMERLARTNEIAKNDVNLAIIQQCFIYVTVGANQSAQQASKRVSSLAASVLSLATKISA